VQTEQTSEQWQTTWSDIDWAATEAIVGRLQGRIYRAAAAGNSKQVKNLQKLLVRSVSAKRLAVRRVTQQNAGRDTPGVDGVVCRTPASRARLATGLSLRDYRPQPVRRVYIPKSYQPPLTPTLFGDSQTARSTIRCRSRRFAVGS